MCDNSFCLILISESEVMRFLGCGIVCMVFLTLNQIIEITSNPKQCLCTQKWNQTHVPIHQFCGKELGKDCEPDTKYNCTQYLSPAIFRHHCPTFGGYYYPSCSPTAYETCNYSRDLVRCKSKRLCISKKSAREEMIKTYGEKWEETLLS
jgi:hypothetical protein